MNDKHYPKGSSKGGQFAPKDASDVSARNYFGGKTISIVAAK